jgi:response regulator RpfG family c-di-GMP phosphodiesterase
MPEAKILVVDDEPAITVALAKKLRREGYECLTASSGEEALRRLATENLDLVVTDVRMPGMSGIELLQEIKRRDPDIQVIMMTAYTDIGFAVEALRHKADDYLLKPFNLAELSHNVARALEHRRLLRENRAYQEADEGSGVAAATELDRFCRQAIAALAAAIDSRDKRARGNLESVGRYAVATGAELGLSDEAQRNLWLGAVLHDIGMLVVPENVLNKQGALSEEEWRLIRRHPVIGAAIVEGVPFLEPARPCILQHHERWDGSGYPDGLHSGEITLEGCIVAIADAYAAMLDERPYRGSRSEAEALAEIERCAGTQFDRRIVEAFHEARGKGFPGGLFHLDVPAFDLQTGWLSEER